MKPVISGKNRAQQIQFKWFDDKTGRQLKKIQGQDENYGAKIVPGEAGRSGALYALIISRGKISP